MITVGEDFIIKKFIFFLKKKHIGIMKQLVFNRSYTRKPDTNTSKCSVCNMHERIVFRENICVVCAAVVYRICIK